MVVLLAYVERNVVAIIIVETIHLQLPPTL